MLRANNKTSAALGENPVEMLSDRSSILLISTKNHRQSLLEEQPFGLGGCFSADWRPNTAQIETITSWEFVRCLYLLMTVILARGSG